ncbi:hypothetical protein LU689_24015 [Pseudomonas asiatica]|uniref:hypothetical protein n=1 Tax=Pseudomonas asiatica TaxID=2219225 RepID=UPI001E295FAF|nr:hypothetical protein [Pseudomonas asiatica]MCE0852981.1 hypothetical protein [Pseudomonas asiatica]
MSDEAKPLGLSGRVGCCLAAIAVLFPPIPLLFGKISIDVFLALEAVWLLVAGALVLGADTISKISFGVASIHMDRKKAEIARDEAKEILDRVRAIARVTVENSYIISCTTDELRRNPTSPAAERLSQNMNDLWKWVEPDERVAHYAHQDVRALFGHTPMPYKPSTK